MTSLITALITNQVFISKEHKRFLNVKLRSLLIRFNFITSTARNHLNPTIHEHSLLWTANYTPTTLQSVLGMLQSLHTARKFYITLKSVRCFSGVTKKKVIDLPLILNTICLMITRALFKRGPRSITRMSCLNINII